MTINQCGATWVEAGEFEAGRMARGFMTYLKRYLSTQVAGGFEICLPRNQLSCVPDFEDV